MTQSDWKRDPRVRDPELLKALHREWKECALCGSIGYDNRIWIGLSLHHINKHPRDDVRGNLVMLCGHGTIGCHAFVESSSSEHLGMLGLYVVQHRPDVIEYLDWRMGGLAAAQEWLQRVLRVPSQQMPPLTESSGQRGAP